MLRPLVLGLALALVATPALAVEPLFGHEGHEHASASVAATTSATASIAPAFVYACPMRCVPPQPQPGHCSRCGMTLRKRKA